MSAYADLIPGSARKRPPSAYDDLVPGGTPAPVEALPAAVEPPEVVAQAPSTGIPVETTGIVDRIKNAIFAASPKPATALPPDGIKIEQPDTGGATTVMEAVRDRAEKLARERGFDMGAPPVKPPVVEPTRAFVGPQEGPLVPMGGGTRMEALKAIPGVAGDTVVKQAAGLVRAGAEAAADFDVPGANALAARARAAAMAADRSQRQAMMPFTETPSVERGGIPAEKLPGKAFDWVFSPANIAQSGAQAPQLAGAAASLAGAPVGATLLASMGLPVTGQAYHDYREKGYEAPVALLGAMGQAVTETVPEVAWVKFAQRTRLADLKGFTTMAPAEQADVIRGLGKGYGIIGLSELGQEEVSTIGNFLIDVAMRDPEATLDKLAKDMAETVRQVAIIAPAMGGAAHVGQTLAGRVRESAAGRAQVLADELQRAVQETDLGALEGNRPATEAAPPRRVIAAVPPPPVTEGAADATQIGQQPIVDQQQHQGVDRIVPPNEAYRDLIPEVAAGGETSGGGDSAAQSARVARADVAQGELVFGAPVDEKTGEPVEPPVVEMPKSPVKLVPLEELKTMRVQAANWARKNIVDTTVKNTQTGFDILIPWQGVKHTIGHNSYPVDVATVPAIPGMLETGRLVETKQDEKARRDIKAVHTFLSRAMVGKDVYRVLLTVRELKDGKRYYDHVALQKETPSDKAGTGAKTTTEYGTSPKGAVESVRPSKPPREDPENLGAPASTTITTGPTIPPVPPAAAGGTQPPKAGAASPHGGKARPDAIRAEMQKLFETVISEKHQGHRYLGIYKVTPEVIRVKNRNDLRTISHEVGHHISNKNKPMRATMTKHSAELMPIAPRAYQGKGHTRKFMTEEGFAEFIAEYLTDRPVARTKAPGFFREFESWLFTNPRYREAIKQVADMIGAHQALGPADKILAKVGAYTPPWSERAVAAFSKDTWNSFVQGTLNAWHPLKLMVDDLMPGVAASANPAIAARLVAGDAAVIEDWINDFTSPYDYQKRMDRKNDGKPLKAIFEPILAQGDAVTNDFKAYLTARRAHELKRAGKENLFDAQEIADGLALETPEFKKVAAEVYAYNDRLLDYAVEGGYLSPEVALKFKQYAAYIPFFREAENEEGGKKAGSGGNAFKKLTGGTANIRDPIANLIQNTANIIHAVNRNQVIAKAAALAQAVPGGGLWMESVPNATQVMQVATDRIIEQLKKQGVQIDASMAQPMADMQQFFSKQATPDPRKRVITYREAGEQKSVQVNDPLLWKFLGNMTPLDMGLIGNLLALPAKTLRAGVVAEPTFMARNVIRDTLSSMIQSKGKFVPGVTTAQGMKMMAQKSDAYKLYRSFGGGFSDQFREPEDAAKIIERMAKRGSFKPSSIITPSRWLDALRWVGSMSEGGSRVGEFAKTYKPGDFESALEAAVNAREVSTDFGMRGGNPAVQALTKVTPFLNPALQGLYKTGRVLAGADGRQAQVKAAVVGSAMALASMALALLNADEDWYKKLEEWEKATYWHFKLGGEIYRIPKPFEYGALFASMPEAIALLQQGKEDWPDFKKRMLQVLGTFGLRVVPQAATIVAEPWANKSIFTGRKLVPDRNQHLEPGLQANPGSSKSAQLAGEATNVSPAVIDNVVRNVFGTVGVHVTTAADVLLEKTGVVPEGREKTWRSWPGIKAFVHDPDNPNSKQMRDFYDELEKYRAAVNTVKEYGQRGEEKKQEAYAKEKTPELELAKRAENAARLMAEVRKATRAIERDPGLTPAEKREQINLENARGQEAVEGFDQEARGTRLYLKAREASNTAVTENR